MMFVDASGRWPSRGFFRAVAGVTGEPQRVYEAAHENGDLALGDAHLVECGTDVASASAQPPSLWVVMLVVLHCRSSWSCSAF